MSVNLQNSPPVNEATSRPRDKRWNALRDFFSNPKAAVGAGIFGFFVILGILGPFIRPYGPEESSFLPNEAPSAQHWMGTTGLGQDVFSQFLSGTHITLIVGVGSGVISTFLALLIGVTAGYRGGWTDAILSGLMNIFLVMPGLALLIVIESYVKNSTPLLNGLIIGLTSWAWGARVLRSQTMSLIGRDFVLAAKLSGMSTFRIMALEIVPNMLSIVAANLMYACLGGILAESGLAFLGFENLNTPSWGTILYWANSNGAMMGGAWWWFVPPGLAIAFVGLSFTLMNFSVDQMTNPRLRETGRRTRRARTYTRA